MTKEYPPAFVESRYISPVAVPLEPNPDDIFFSEIARIDQEDSEHRGMLTRVIGKAIQEKIDELIPGPVFQKPNLINHEDNLEMCMLRIAAEDRMVHDVHEYTTNHGSEPDEELRAEWLNLNLYDVCQIYVEHGYAEAIK